MKLNTKNRKYSILALVAAFFIATLTAVGLLVSDYIASARTIELSGSNYFYTSNNAEIEEYALSETNSHYAESTTHFVGFNLSSDSDYITYRKNLAYKWQSEAGDAGIEYFGMTVGFSSLSFETFTIKFQSQQYTLTKDGVTSNYLTFVAGKDDNDKDCVYILATTEEPDEDAINHASADSEAFDYESITITFTGYSRGVYTVEIADGTTTDSTYTFKNIGSTYAKYVSSSSSNSVIPLTFSASGVSGSAEMILYELNRQSFATTSDGSVTVTDTVAPVLCVDDEFSSVRYGYGLELNYAVIDVLATSPRTTIYYYVLTDAQATTDNLDLDTASDDVVYTSVSSTDTYAFIDPVGAYEGANGEKDGYVTKCLVKIYLEIKDTTASTGNPTEVYLEWYVNEDELEQVNGYSFIRAVRDIDGVGYDVMPSDYTYEDETSGQDVTESYADSYPDATFAYSDLDSLQAAYQAEVTQFALDQDITAGDTNYFYLPSFEGYVTDNLSGYQDLTYSIYYVAGTSSSVSSNTGLAYNELSITLSDEGTYRFVIFATDSESNDMYYWVADRVLNETTNEYETQWEKKTFTSTDISDMLADAESDLWAYVPYFEFSVTYEGLVVEVPGAQDIAYVDIEYSADDFDITGLNSGYTTEYMLFEFKREEWQDYYEKEENGDYTVKDSDGEVIATLDDTISYSEMLSYITYLMEDTSISEYFKQIIALSDLDETQDSYYDDYCDYEWDPDSLSFVAQEATTFYVIMLRVTDDVYKTDKVVRYMVISSSASAAELTGESRWLQDNLASVILLAVAAASLIGIILLVVIKPKEKGDIDLIDLSEDDKKSRKKIEKGKK